MADRVSSVPSSPSTMRERFSARSATMVLFPIRNTSLSDPR